MKCNGSSTEALTVAAPRRGPRDTCHRVARPRGDERFEECAVVDQRPVIYF